MFSTRKNQVAAHAEVISAIDTAIANADSWRLPPHARASLAQRLIELSMSMHLRTNAAYRDYASRVGYNATGGSAGDLASVPLLPALLFKRRTATPGQFASRDVQITTSSGTSGGLSAVPRDNLTLMRFYSSIGNVVLELLDIETPNIRLFSLVPDLDEVTGLWVAFVMAGMRVFFPTMQTYVESGEFLRDFLIRDLSGSSDERVVIVGPPGHILDLVREIRHRDVPLTLRDDSFVITIGGWKRRQEEAVEKSAFRSMVSHAFGIAETQVRDSFNMVELNAVMLECEHHRLHVPPWVVASARDPDSLEPLPSAGEGVLAYLDPTPTSFPGFILSDDLGIVETSLSCDCGRQTDVVHIVRRLKTMEARGCALKLDGERLR